MGHIKILTVTFAALIILGCSGTITVAPVDEQSGVEVSTTAVPPIIIPQKTTIKTFDPLEDKKLTFSATNVPVQTVLYTIAMDAGLNLVINPDVKLTDTISANFINTPMKDALEIIMELGDIFYEIRGNILRITKYQTNIYSVPYLTSLNSFTLNLGGDIVGAADREGDSNLKGEFTMEGKKEEDDVNFVKQLEENINKMLSNDKNSSVNINKFTGIISVRTTFNKMQEVESFLYNAVENSVRQVQIEARIMEVVLSDGYSYGINWTNILGSGSTMTSMKEDFTSIGTLKMSITDNFQGIIKAIATYGKVDTLSNPRLTLLSGQNAMISAGTIMPYWEREVTHAERVTTITYTKYNVLDGLILGLTAYVHDDDTIMLHIVPITSSIQRDEKNMEGDEVVGKAPVIEIKELGTTVLMDNESTLVIGGLISNNQKTETNSVPILGSIPLLGYLFSSETMSYEKRELVILIKPIVVPTKAKVIKR